MNASLCNESLSNDSKHTKEKNVNYMAFTASVKSANDFLVCNPFVLFKTCDKESQSELDEEINLQEAYNQLLMKLNKVEFENESLCVKLHDVNLANDSLRYEILLLVIKVKFLEDHLVDCKSNLSNFCSENKIRLLILIATKHATKYVKQ
jgi:hypothetical protein